MTYYIPISMAHTHTHSHHKKLTIPSASEELE